MPVMPDAQGHSHGMDVGVPAGDMPNFQEDELVDRIRRVPNKETRSVLLAIIDNLGGPVGPPTPPTP